MQKINSQIHCGDNLVILRKFPDDCVDLCYIDPPFWSQRKYETIWNDKEEISSFEDRWGGGIEKYIEWMEERVREIHRVLKSTGSFYLHCDYHAVAYLRVMCDRIFGYDNFQSEIIWKRSSNRSAMNKIFKREHDTILFYTKSPNYIFNMQFKPISENTLKNYRYEDKKGKYRLVPLLVSGTTERGETGQEWLGVDPKKQGKAGMHWVCKLETREQYVKDDLVVMSKNGIPNLKYYLATAKGVPMNDVWDDISLIQSNDSESLGYPTQKPEVLLERIISVSSNEGDIVLDAFCGCGTAVAVAKRLNRQFIGIDISSHACVVIGTRLGISTIEMPGYPTTDEDVIVMSPDAFQVWVCEKMNAIPSVRFSGDKGIDGRTRNTNYPIQAKLSSIGRNVVDNFETAMRREKKDHGAIVGKKFATGAVEETSRTKREEGLFIYLYTIADIRKGKSFLDGFSKGVVDSPTLVEPQNDLSKWVKKKKE